MKKMSKIKWWTVIKKNNFNRNKITIFKKNNFNNKSQFTKKKIRINSNKSIKINNYKDKANQ